MHLYHIPQCSIQKRNVHFSALNGTLRDMDQVHFWICEIDQCQLPSSQLLLWSWQRQIINKLDRIQFAQSYNKWSTSLWHSFCMCFSMHNKKLRIYKLRKRLLNVTLNSFPWCVYYVSTLKLVHQRRGKIQSEYVYAYGQFGIRTNVVKTAFSTMTCSILQGSSRLCNWLTLRRLVPWINHLPPVSWSTFWKYSLRW